MIGDDKGSSTPEHDDTVPRSQISSDAPADALVGSADVSPSKPGISSGDEPSLYGMHATATPRTEPADNTDAPTFTAVTAVLTAAVVILLAAVVYLYSLLPSETRLANNERTLADLRSQVASVDVKTSALDVTPFNQRVEGVEKQLASIRSDIGALQQQRAPDAGSSPSAAQVDALGKQVSDLQHGLDPLRAAVEDLSKRVDASDARASALQDKVASIPAVDLGPVNARIGALESGLKPLIEEAQAAKSPARASEARQNGSAAEERAAPLAVTAEAILRAIEVGRPFGDDLKALRNLGADAAATQPLAAVAEAGAPTTENLRSDLAALRERIITEGAPAPTGSYLDRLMAGAATVVSVRPMGSVPGDTPAAIVARMDDELRRDDLSAALADWQKLPEASRTASKGLADRIRLRLDAQNAAKSIAASAIQTMAARP